MVRDANKTLTRANTRKPKRVDVRSHLDTLEIAIFAAAYDRSIADARRTGITARHRQEAADEGLANHIVDYWEKAYVSQAIDDACCAVRMFRDGLKRTESALAALTWLS